MPDRQKSFAVISVNSISSCLLLRFRSSRIRRRTRLWHSDVIYKRKAGTWIHTVCEGIAALCGDTMFANIYREIRRHEIHAAGIAGGTQRRPKFCAPRRGSEEDRWSRPERLPIFRSGGTLSLKIILRAEVSAMKAVVFTGDPSGTIVARNISRSTTTTAIFGDEPCLSRTQRKMVRRAAKSCNSITIEGKASGTGDRTVVAKSFSKSKRQCAAGPSSVSKRKTEYRRA